jgi:hypothetical protein
MAILIKNSNTQRTGGVAGNGQAMVAQLIHVNRPAATITQNTATEMLFRVFGGAVLIHHFLGRVTTAIQNQACTLTFTSKQLSAAGVAVGTAVDLAAASTVTNKEIGSFVRLLGSGAAAIVSNAGAALATLGQMGTIVPQGEIYATASANNSGALQYDLWYQPLDEGAYVVAQAALTTVI